MAETDVDTLITAIRRDGVEKAQEMAATIEREAQARAQDMIRGAEEECAQLREAAQEEIARQQKSSHALLRQSAHNVTLLAMERIQVCMERILHQEVATALTAERFADIIVGLYNGMFKEASGQPRLRIHVAETMRAEIGNYIIKKLREEARQGIVIKVDPNLNSGFRFSVADGAVSYEITHAAVADALAAIVPQHLRALLSEERADSDSSA